MATNTSSSAFRKIDVDQYNEDNYREDEQGELQSPPVGPDESEVTHLLNHNKSNASILAIHYQNEIRRLEYSITLYSQLNSYYISYIFELRGNNIEALKIVLRNAPLASKNQVVKDNALNLTLKVLMSFKSSQIDDAVNTLDVELIDVLMKYIYRGFEYPSEKGSGQLLLWHEKVYAVGGVGSIVRVLTESKRA